MDRTAVSPVDQGPEAGGPVVIGANWYRFRVDQRIRVARIESVCFLWVVQGSGSVTTGGRTHSLSTSTVLRLPWGHDVDYEPHGTTPLHIGTVHLVPWHSLAVAVEPRVAFRADDPLLGVPWRRGPAEPGIAAELPSRSVPGRSIIGLASYCVERFLTGRTEEPALRALGGLIAEESGLEPARETEPTATPVALQAMTEHILSRLDQPLTVAEVARIGDCSTATAERLFSRYTGHSVVSWTRHRRMQEAAILLRTTGLRVTEVARRVGFSDPAYFSRVFSAVHGTPPSRYTEGQLRP
ncbi:MAG: helix-turn-helix transcriptional regulator [Microbacteriaceae bacterium]|nr:AraC family transcriptional regulator [Actinomycetota bacterium]MCC6855920.1 helix-turn-helix transcriptional regulator [Microbacteriaceae bacterium]HOB56114.1 AraC family transcriptional regulator [Rhodoglobus sp.]HOY80768.1 AraC family transcriptional regulator [Rhodoglobus sp.]HPG74759.1 AraC family transcriptional regulator [Rhodoglobus sp.]